MFMISLPPPLSEMSSSDFLLIIGITVSVFRGHMMSFNVILSKQKIKRKNHQNWMPKSELGDGFSSTWNCM
jgi:hypothetical protein